MKPSGCGSVSPDDVSGFDDGGREFRDLEMIADTGQVLSEAQWVQRLYPILRSSPWRHSTSVAVSMPLGDDPSMTPSTPLPCSVWATITSTGLAVAQKMLQTSGVSGIRFLMLMGKPPRNATTKRWPAPMAVALLVAIVLSSSSLPSTRVKQAPDASLNAMPNF